MTSDPKDTGAGPGGTSTSDPKGSTSDPNSSTSDPKTSTSDPRGSTSDPGTSTSDPRVSTSDPNNATSDPGRTSTSDPKVSTSDPNSSTPDPRGSTPDPADVRAELDRVLGSALFATAGRHSRLLRYVVERTLAGDGDQLKEYVLGTEVFDRPDSYDPRIDSIVRVEVRRLRSRLEDYYRGTGASDTLLITIPRGSYAPLFEHRPLTLRHTEGRESTPHETAPSQAAAPAAARTYSTAAIIATALGVALVVLTAGVAINRDRAPAQASARPGVAVLPFEHYSADPGDALLVARLTDAVTTALARTGTVSVVSRTSASRYTGGRQSVAEIAKALSVDFVIEASARVIDDRVEVVARLVDGRLDRKVWVAEYAFGRDQLVTAAQQIAADASAAVLRVRP